jgi:hypothetical protein
VYVFVLLLLHLHRHHLLLLLFPIFSLHRTKEVFGCLLSSSGLEEFFREKKNVLVARLTTLPLLQLLLTTSSFRGKLLHLFGCMVAAEVTPLSVLSMSSQRCLTLLQCRPLNLKAGRTPLKAEWPLANAVEVKVREKVIASSAHKPPTFSMACHWCRCCCMTTLASKTTLCGRIYGETETNIRTAQSALDVTTSHAILCSSVDTTSHIIFCSAAFYFARLQQHEGTLGPLRLGPFKAS